MNVRGVANRTNNSFCVLFIISNARLIDFRVSGMISNFSGALPSSISFILYSAGIALLQRVSKKNCCCSTKTLAVLLISTSGGTPGLILGEALYSLPSIIPRLPLIASKCLSSNILAISLQYGRLSFVISAMNLNLTLFLVLASSFMWFHIGSNKTKDAGLFESMQLSRLALI